MELEPGENTIVNVKYHASSRPVSRVTKTIRVYTNDPLNREYSVQLQGTVVDD